MASSRILLVEDDPNLSFVIEDHLALAGYDVKACADGEKALLQFQQLAFDLCIVDVMMPRMDGFTLVEHLRKQNEFIPILFLTARSMEQDRLRGFEIGGDDYITKPFSMQELLYRVKVFLRRSGGETSTQDTGCLLGKYLLDEVNLHLQLGDMKIQLTQMEADLLKMLMNHRNQLVKREEILVAIWGENDYFKGRSLDVFISRLRKYLKEDDMLEIRNHHGVGFTLVDRNFSG